MLKKGIVVLAFIVGAVFGAALLPVIALTLELVLKMQLPDSIFFLFLVPNLLHLILLISGALLGTEIAVKLVKLDK